MTADVWRLEVDVRVDEVLRLLAHDRHDLDTLRCARRLLESAEGWAETRAPPDGSHPLSDEPQEIVPSCHEQEPGPVTGSPTSKPGRRRPNPSPSNCTPPATSSRTS